MQETRVDDCCMDAWILQLMHHRLGFSSQLCSCVRSSSKVKSMGTYHRLNCSRYPRALARSKKQQLVICTGLQEPFVGPLQDDARLCTPCAVCFKRATAVGAGDVVWFLGRRGGPGAGERAVGWGQFHLATRFCSLSDFPCGHAFFLFIQKSRL